MSQCPFTNLLDPDTYAAGMPYQSLREIRNAGPVLRIEDPLTGVPYWVITRRDDMDFVAKNPALFSSAARSAFPMEFDITRAERMPDLYKQLRSFGIGQHFCIGTHLARLELRIMFEEIIPRLRHPGFQGEPKFVRSFFVNAMKKMDISFEPEVADADAA